LGANFLQDGGAIYNGGGTLTVKYGNFTGNSADDVCILAPHSQYPYQKCSKSLPARDFRNFSSLF
jgi:hypothetical protein